MIETAQQVATIISGTVTALAAIFSVIAVIVLLRSKTEALEKAETSIKTDIKETRDMLNSLTTLLKVHMAEQQVMHQMNSAALKGVIDRIEKLEESVEKLKGE